MYVVSITYQYQAKLDSMQSARTITFELILFELFPLEFCHKIVSALLFENLSRYLHKTSFEYKSSLDIIQSIRANTLAFTCFELFPLECCLSQNVT